VGGDSRLRIRDGGFQSLEVDEALKVWTHEAMQNAKCKMQTGSCGNVVVDVVATFTPVMPAVSVCILNLAF
jgi:hypothetical protein